MAIARKYLEPQTREAAGIPEGSTVLTDDAMRELITEFARRVSAEAQTRSQFRGRFGQPHDAKTLLLPHRIAAAQHAPSCANKGLCPVMLQALLPPIECL